MFVACIKSFFLVIAKLYSLYGCTTICLYIVNVWTFRLLALLSYYKHSTYEYLRTSLGGDIHCIFTCKNLGVEWLDHTVGIWLAFKGTAKLFSKGQRLSNIPTCNIQEFQLLQLLTNTW